MTAALGVKRMLGFRVGFSVSSPPLHAQCMWRINEPAGMWSSYREQPQHMPSQEGSENNMMFLSSRDTPNTLTC